MTKSLTKKELEQLLHKTELEKFEAMGEKNKLYDRMRLVGLYIQCLRLIPCYSEKSASLEECDYERILGILEMNSYPDGF